MKRLVFLLLACALILVTCGRKADMKDATAVVAISGDAEGFNPIVNASTTSSEINTNIFPRMFDLTFNLNLGQLEFHPALVTRWESTNNGLDVVLHLRRDVKWEDGTVVSADDIKFSYELYGDDVVASPRGNYVDNMIFTDGKFDVDKSITIIDDTTMVFHFTHRYPQQLFHLGLSPISKRLYRNADRRTLRANPLNERPLSAGPFRLEKWVRQQEIILASNPKCNLPGPAPLERAVLRVITEPTTRLTEFKKGAVDLMWPIYPEDVKDIQSRDIKLETLPPRVYEYVGWANIDLEEYNKTDGHTVRPHKLFGDARVRQALTYAINRKGIMEAKLGAYGELAVSDFSPIFRWAFNNSLVPYPYDPNEARQSLKQAGWTDTDGDGILDKSGLKFEFNLAYNTGNTRRAYAATVIQENLKQIGIKVNLVTAEPVVFFKNLDQKKYDAFIAGFSVGLAIDPSGRWGDLKAPFNNIGYQNARVRELINLGLHCENDRDAARFWKEIQAILHQEQPCTFLYWIKDIVGVNRRIKNANINILGMLDGMGHWRIGDPNAYATF
jgi:peptide/nickel transport system substrate-binding protein